MYDSPAALLDPLTDEHPTTQLTAIDLTDLPPWPVMTATRLSHPAISVSTPEPAFRHLSPIAGHLSHARPPARSPRRATPPPIVADRHASPSSVPRLQILDHVSSDFDGHLTGLLRVLPERDRRDPEGHVVGDSHREITVSLMASIPNPHVNSGVARDRSFLPQLVSTLITSDLKPSQSPYSAFFVSRINADTDASLILPRPATTRTGLGGDLVVLRQARSRLTRRSPQSFEHLRGNKIARPRQIRGDVQRITDPTFRSRTRLRRTQLACRGLSHTIRVRRAGNTNSSHGKHGDDSKPERMITHQTCFFPNDSA
ncbi:hypothetical protein SaccyDRAFT_1700 [Saccharomonospora cyanea NA-134]|uniref:Uncharacterized protein n=1 Tax=Saccharomonospora cyanea NA-134 TaxID=882082 RepID=H5XHB3_9PSEU|nr:hypothetical protein SaccyDRAFT_1700 [Saccharomonospora cyanea NA-134]